MGPSVLSLILKTEIKNGSLEVKQKLFYLSLLHFTNSIKASLVHSQNMFLLPIMSLIHNFMVDVNTSYMHC